MTPPQSKSPADAANIWQITQLNAVRLIIVLAISLGYASTMSMGQGNHEWGHHWGYDPSW